MLSTILQLFPNVQEELSTDSVWEVQDPVYGCTYHIVTPVAHCLFEVIGAAICPAQTLQTLNAEQLVLLLLAHTAHRAAQSSSHTEVGF